MFGEGSIQADQHTRSRITVCSVVSLLPAWVAIWKVYNFCFSETETCRLYDRQRLRSGNSSDACRSALSRDEVHWVTSADIIENSPEVSAQYRRPTEQVSGSFNDSSQFARRDSLRP